MNNGQNQFRYSDDKEKNTFDNGTVVIKDTG